MIIKECIDEYKDIEKELFRLEMHNDLNDADLRRCKELQSQKLTLLGNMNTLNAHNIHQLQKVKKWHSEMTSKDMNWQWTIMREKELNDEIRLYHSFLKEINH